VIVFWCLLSSLLLAALMLLIVPILRFNGKQKNKSILFISVFISILSLSLYSALGSYSGAAKQVWARSHANDINNVLISKVKLYLRTHPKDSKAWYLLGRLEQMIGDFKSARQAYKKASRT